MSNDGRVLLAALLGTLLAALQPATSATPPACTPPACTLPPARLRPGTPSSRWLPG